MSEYLRRGAPDRHHQHAARVAGRHTAV